MSNGHQKWFKVENGSSSAFCLSYNAPGTLSLVVRGNLGLCVSTENNLLELI